MKWHQSHLLIFSSLICKTYIIKLIIILMFSKEKKKKKCNDELYGKGKRPSIWVGTGGIRKDRFAILNLSHLPEERFFHKLIRIVDNNFRILYLQHGYPPLLVDANRWGMHELLLHRMNPYSHTYPNHSKQHIQWG